jgi:signal transduction histidine kinase
MDTADLIQAISAGVCFYAGGVHLMIGLRSEPKDRVHLSFAVVSLLFGLYSVGLFALYVTFDTGSLSFYVFVDRWGIALYYLAIAALFWFIAAYTGAKNRVVLFILTGLYILIAISNFILPYPWVYTDIKLTAAFPPDIVVAPWYSVEQVVTFLLIFLYSAYCINKQYHQGEKNAARVLGIAVGIFLITILWDYSIEYGLIDTVLMAQYGFVALIVIMSLRLSGQVVKAEKEVYRLNIELENRVLARTAELSEANQQLRQEMVEREQAEAASQQYVEELSTLHSIAKTMAAITNLPKALNAVAETVTYLFDAELTLITVSTVENGELRTLAGYLHNTSLSVEAVPTFPINEIPATRQVLEEGTSLVLTDFQARPLGPAVRTYVEELALQTIMIVPLQVRGAIVGTLAVGASQAGRIFTTDEVALAETIAGDIAAAVKTAQLSEQAKLAAVDAERQRLARELHDSVTQSLYSLTLLTNGWGTMAAQGRLDQQQLVDAFRQLGDIGQQGLKEMRLLIYQLRPPVLEKVGLVGALQQRLDAVEQRMNVETHLYTQGAVDELPLTVAEQLFYTALEALNNALRHARATEVTIHLQAEDDCLKLSIRDNGVGFDPAAPSMGLGLTTMQERAEAVEGKMSITAAPQQGTMVEITVALEPDERV